MKPTKRHVGYHRITLLDVTVKDIEIYSDFHIEIPSWKALKHFSFYAPIEATVEKLLQSWY